MVYIAMGHLPFSHDIMDNQLQPACIVCFFGCQILSVAFQSFSVPQYSQMFQGAYGTCFDRHSSACCFGGYLQLCHCAAIFTYCVVASSHHFCVRLAVQSLLSLLVQLHDHLEVRASGRNVGKVFNPVVKLVLENQPFLMPEPAEKPSLHSYLRERYRSSTQKLVQEHERSLHRRACCGNHHIFNMRCHDEGVIPSSRRIKPPVKKDLCPEEDQSIWSKRWQGFQPCCEAGIREPILSHNHLAVKGVGMVQLFCMHVMATYGVGVYIAIANIPPDGKSEWQQNMIGIVGVTP